MGELKVRFLPEGGFHKNGTFIECEGEGPNGHETEYQRQGYLTLDIICTDFKLGMSFGVVSEYEEVAERSTGGRSARMGQYSPPAVGKAIFPLLFWRERQHP